ncbi:hypothetical protein ONZ43_g4200 [Nemania bipapillata]|uniref:Uncharacterized protein n=1 Tax=Nemania bipapillata TaxID=110536 RepID=A0ACC2IQP3_9PEZI|nr:hypothetical protein ONZ43_g4200 [Nemania bipapillata]
MPAETYKLALLERALDNADESILRDVLKSMCHDSEVCRREVMDRMLVSQKRTVIELSDSSDNDTQKKQITKRKKVEVTHKSRYERCETCKESYDIALNDDEACQTHEGALPI